VCRVVHRPLCSVDNDDTTVLCILNQIFLTTKHQLLKLSRLHRLTLKAPAVRSRAAHSRVVARAAPNLCFGTGPLLAACRLLPPLPADVVIYEGERSSVSGNTQIGEFVITGIERAKRGEAKVEMCMELDAVRARHDMIYMCSWRLSRHTAVCQLAAMCSASMRGPADQLPGSLARPSRPPQRDEEM
jgi:hypothetical protein